MTHELKKSTQNPNKLRSAVNVFVGDMKAFKANWESHSVGEKVLIIASLGSVAVGLFSLKESSDDKRDAVIASRQRQVEEMAAISDLRDNIREVLTDEESLVAATAHDAATTIPSIPVEGGTDDLYAKATAAGSDFMRMHPDAKFTENIFDTLRISASVHEQNSSDYDGEYRAMLVTLPSGEQFVIYVPVDTALHSE